MHSHVYIKFRQREWTFNFLFKFGDFRLNASTLVTFQMFRVGHHSDWPNDKSMCAENKMADWEINADFERKFSLTALKRCHLFLARYDSQLANTIRLLLQVFDFLMFHQQFTWVVYILI